MDGPSLLAKEFNRHVLEVADQFEDHYPTDALIEFLCECGCLGRVKRTAGDYHDRGAWLPGHPLRE